MGVRMKAELKRKTFLWYVVLKSNNGEVLLTSELYFSKGNASRALKRLNAALTPKRRST